MRTIIIDNIVCDCEYHVVFCTKHKRPVLIDEVAKMLKNILKEKAAELKVELIEIEITFNYVYLLISCDTFPGIHLTIKKLKDYSSRVLRENFPHLVSTMPSMWTRNYFCSTKASLDIKMMEEYLEREVTRGKTTLPYKNEIRTFTKDYQLKCIKDFKDENTDEILIQKNEVYNCSLESLYPGFETVYWDTYLVHYYKDGQNLSIRVPRDYFEHLPMSDKQIEKLKRKWEANPTFNIECTDGFEGYREELLEYRKSKETNEVSLEMIYDLVKKQQAILYNQSKIIEALGKTKN